MPPPLTINQLLSIRREKFVAKIGLEFSSLHDLIGPVCLLGSLVFYPFWGVEKLLYVGDAIRRERGSIADCLESGW
jgi:hypothetical protein